MTTNQSHILPSRIIVFMLGSDGKPTWSIVASEDARRQAAEGEIITAAEVSQWFAAAAPNWQNPALSNARVARLAADLNLLRVTTESPIRRSGSRAEKIAATKKAIAALDDALPELIEGAAAHRAAMLKAGRPPMISEDGLAALEALHLAAIAAATVFKAPTPTPRTEPWHKAAALIAWHAEQIWRSRGRADIGANPTSPLVKLIGVILPRIGEPEVAAETIARELQRARAKPTRPLPFTILNAGPTE